MTACETFCDDFYEFFHAALIEVGITEAILKSETPEYTYKLPVCQIGIVDHTKPVDISSDSLRFHARRLAQRIAVTTGIPEFYKLTPLGPFEEGGFSTTISGKRLPQGSVRITYKNSDETLRIECAFAEAA